MIRCSPVARLASVGSKPPWALWPSGRVPGSEVGNPVQDGYPFRESIHFQYPGYRKPFFVENKEGAIAAGLSRFRLFSGPPRCRRERRACVRQ
ncbi:protein of unknown function [Azospirillum baldaniorum]|uniref:Uncharacterized protein n=1 Tax=Azospirillum baldaniorum TaxID=1064539 RepID=A0A9P1NLK9_9PROT|nr:protein of unknown function [Azospirillum baldaniorum]